MLRFCCAAVVAMLPTLAAAQSRDHLYDFGTVRVFNTASTAGDFCEAGDAPSFVDGRAWTMAASQLQWAGKNLLITLPRLTLTDGRADSRAQFAGAARLTLNNARNKGTLRFFLDGLGAVDGTPTTFPVDFAFSDYRGSFSPGGKADISFLLVIKTTFGSCSFRVDGLYDNDPAGG